ncbi:MAG: DUF2079 domain-containing protein [Eubacteriales bacterium]|nr:DUF2079 domain-containing protein [Clostridiales bacterium]
MSIYFSRAVAAWFAAFFVTAYFGGKDWLLTPAYASNASLIYTGAIFAAVYVVLTFIHKITGKDTVDRASLAIITAACAILIARESQNPFVITAVSAGVAVAIIYAERSIGPLLSSLKVPRGVLVCGAALAALFFAVFTGGLTSLRYLTYSTPNYDFGIFVNMFHNMRTRLLPLVTCERDMLLSHFKVHISPIYYLILPFYALFPSPLTLQIAQAVILASGVLPIYLLCKKKGLSDKYGFAFSLIYALYPALSGGCFYDIHENCFLAPLILWTLYFFECRKFAAMFVSAALVLLVKEDAPVYTAFIGIYMLFSGSNAGQEDENTFYRRHRCKINGIILFCASLVYFLFAAYYLNTHGQGVMAYRYENFLDFGQNGLLDFVRNVIVNPALVFGESFDMAEKIAFLLLMLAPLAFLPVMTAKPARFILLLPMLLVNHMSDYQYQYSIWFQYVFGSLAFLFYLAIVNAAELGERARRCAVLVSAAAAAVAFSGTSLTKLYYIDKYKEEYEDNRRITEILEAIPADASVKASSFLVPKLAQRDEIYELQSRNPTDYAVIDLRFDTTRAEARYSLLIARGWTEIVYEEDLVAVLVSPDYTGE